MSHALAKRLQIKIFKESESKHQTHGGVICLLFISLIEFDVIRDLIPMCSFFFRGGIIFPTGTKRSET